MINERELRESIRSIIKFVKQKRLNEEEELRSIIRHMINADLNNLKL